MSFAPSKNLQHEVTELISHYPDGESRSASLMVLHAIQDEAGELRTLSDIERDILQYAIDFYEGHMSEVSRRLGIGRSTLYRKMREYDISPS